MNAVEVRDLTKVYKLYASPKDRLKETLSLSRRSFHQDFFALNGVSLEVRKGETFGIIGQNGSGKSTLLQIICGVLQPTSGGVCVNGRVGALLELGAGFNPEFTGRDNVYMNGTLMGFSRKEIDQKFPQIEFFAEIGGFIDQPVKTYSTGMFVRLAFSAAIHADPEVLVVDEVLAVGDIFFRQKCYKRLAEMQAKGCSIILVSHAMNEVEQFCQRALLLDHGAAVFQGPAPEAVKRYYLMAQGSRIENFLEVGKSADPAAPSSQDGQKEFWPAPEAFLDLSNVAQVTNGWARCTAIALCDLQGRACRSFQQGETASFFYEIELFQSIEVPTGGLEIINEKGLIVHGKSTLEYGSDVPTRVAVGSRLRFRQDIVLEIATGEYTFHIGLGTMNLADFLRRTEYPHPQLDAKLIRLCLVPSAGRFAVLFRANGEPVQLLHHGLCNLRGQCRVAVEKPVEVRD